MAASGKIDYQSALEKALLNTGANKCSIDNLGKEATSMVRFFTLIHGEPTCFTLASNEDDAFIGATVFDRSSLFISATLITLKNKHPESISVIDQSGNLEFDDLNKLIDFSQKRTPFFFLSSAQGIFNLAASSNLTKVQQELNRMLHDIGLSPLTKEIVPRNNSIYFMKTHSVRNLSELENCHLFVTTANFAVDIRDLFYLLGKIQTLHVQHLISVEGGTKSIFELLFKNHSQLDAMAYLENAFLNKIRISDLKTELTKRKSYVLKESSLKESTLNNFSIFSAYLESCGTGGDALFQKGIETTKFYSYLENVKKTDPEEYKKIEDLNILELENKMKDQGFFSLNWRDGRVTKERFIDYFNSLHDGSEWEKTCINDDFMPVMRKIFGLLHLVRIMDEVLQPRYD